MLLKRFFLLFNMTNVTFETTKGNFTIKLYDSKPITTENFVKLVEEGFYDGIAFHRIIDKFMKL